MKSLDKPKVAVIMGSDSDYKIMSDAIDMLKSFGVEYEVRVMSAHRTPAQAEEFSKNAAQNGFGVIIAAAGKAAHLAGVIAANTTLPVIGVPIKSSALGGMDSLFSTVQMPKGIPVATVALDGAANAAILAVQMLSVKFDFLEDKLAEFKINMQNEVIEKDKAMQELVK